MVVGEVGGEAAFNYNIVDDRRGECCFIELLLFKLSVPPLTRGQCGPGKAVRTGGRGQCWAPLPMETGVKVRYAP